MEDIREFALLALELIALSSRSNALFDLHKKRELSKLKAGGRERSARDLLAPHAAFQMSLFMICVQIKTFVKFSNSLPQWTESSCSNG